MDREWAEMAEAMERASRASARVRLNADQMKITVKAMERALSDIHRSRKAKEERELQEGIEYVKKSLGIIE